jgi:hypothetical protein
MTAIAAMVAFNPQSTQAAAWMLIQIEEQKGGMQLQISLTVFSRTQPATPAGPRVVDISIVNINKIEQTGNRCWW